MIKFVTILLIIISVPATGGNTFAQNTGTVPENDSVANVSIISDYDSLLIFLDGVNIGKTPLLNYPAGSGSHEITVRSPFWPSWNQPNYRESFVAMPGRTYRFKADFAKNILVNSIPFGANFYKDGELLGRTPLYIFSNGHSQIRVEKEGHDAVTTDLAKAYEFTLLVTLQPQQHWLQSKELVENTQKMKIKRKRNMLFASIGLTAVSGLLSVQFRNERNDALNEAAGTILTSQKRYYQNRAGQYKKLQDASYIAFELGFVMTGYFFLTSRAGD